MTVERETMAKKTKPAGKLSGSEPKPKSEDDQLEELTSGGDETSESAKVEISESVYRRVGKEVLAKNFDPLCWAKALAGSSGGLMRRFLSMRGFGRRSRRDRCWW